MFNQSGLTRSNLAAMLVASADVSARDDAYDDVDYMNYDGIDNAGLESIPSEILRAMMHAEAFRIFPKA